MKIKDTAITIDMSKITLHSNSPRNVELPYTGKLPADLDATTARIAFNIQAGRPTRVAMIITGRAGKDSRYPVEITTEEIKAILEQIFNDPTISNPGLDPYWLGVWQTNFNAWREMHTPHSLLTAILNLTNFERAKVLSMMQRAIA